jgi:ankyrin repeat protein
MEQERCPAAFRYREWSTIFSMKNQEAFIAAIREGDTERVAALLEADPSLIETRHDKLSPILLALYVGKNDLARFLAERTPSRSFYEACALGELDRVAELLDADPSLLSRYSDDGFAPIGFSTFFGHPEVDRFLLERGGDVHAQATNPMRVGLVHAAAARCDHGMMRLALERGANPNARQQVDYTPLHTAAARGDREMAELLLAHGAERSAKGADGKTPADIAREHGEEEMARWLAAEA